MSFHVKDDFRRGAPVSSVPASWFNAVARFLNNLVGSTGVKVLRDSDPPQVVLDVEAARKALGVPPPGLTSLPAHSHGKSDLTNFDDNVKANIPGCYQAAPVAYTAANDDALLCLVGGVVGYGKLDISGMVEDELSEQVPTAVENYLEGLFEGADDTVSAAIYSNVESLIDEYLGDPQNAEDFADAIGAAMDAAASEAVAAAMEDLLGSGDFDEALADTLSDVMASVAEDVVGAAMEEAIVEYDVEIADAIETAIDVGAEGAVSAEIARLYPGGLAAPIEAEIGSSVSRAVGGYVTTSRIVAALDANAQGAVNSYVNQNSGAIPNALQTGAANAVSTYTGNNPTAIDDAIDAAASSAVSNYASGQYIIDEVDDAIDAAVQTAMSGASVSSKVDDAIDGAIDACDIPGMIDDAIAAEFAASQTDFTQMLSITPDGFNMRITFRPLVISGGRLSLGNATVNTTVAGAI